MSIDNCDKCKKDKDVCCQYVGHYTYCKDCCTNRHPRMTEVTRVNDFNSIIYDRLLTLRGNSLDSFQEEICDIIQEIADRIK